MKLEELKLWRERELLCEEIPKEYGLLGVIYGVFRDGTIDCATDFPMGFNKDIQCEFGKLVSYLQNEGEYFLKDLDRLTAYCKARPHAHVPYKFSRECWGFRVLTDRFAWYISCTPWNDGRHFTVYSYDREILMTQLAEEKGLPCECCAVLPFTGERIIIRYGADSYTVCSENDETADCNKIIVMAQNGMYGASKAQVSAMLNGVLYGWDTPMADPKRYDENGYLKPNDER